MKQVIRVGTATGIFDVPDEPHGGRWQANGRSRGRMPDGTMNRLEKRYSVHLEYRRLQGEIAWWKFDSLKLRLARDTFYETDFIVMLVDGSLEVHEVKGHWEDDARVKVKVAASLFPFNFIGVQERSKGEGGGWKFEQF